MANRAWKIHTEDTVMVLTGKDRGKIGKVIRILRDKNKVVVERVNVVKKHMKPNPYAGKPGGIVEKEMPIDVSNVQLVCPACAKPTRVGYRFTEDDKKLRYCKKCNETIS